MNCARTDYVTQDWQEIPKNVFLGLEGLPEMSSAPQGKNVNINRSWEPHPSGHSSVVQMAELLFVTVVSH